MEISSDQVSTAGITASSLCWRMGAEALGTIADRGRRPCTSPTREAAGINVARWKYDHQAIVSVLRHEYPDHNVAYEDFLSRRALCAAADER